MAERSDHIRPEFNESLWIGLKSTVQKGEGCRLTNNQTLEKLQEITSEYYND